jgi:tetratricopeptide (TPR) repeat protein
VNLTPDGHAEKPSFLNNLGNSFARRFKHSGDLADSDRAISAHERAVNLIPDGHTNKPCCLNSLGNSFARRFEHSGDLADRDRAISAHERAVNLTPDGHADKSHRLNNLGNSFLRRFECSGDLVDSDRAISAHTRAVDLTPDGHADKPARLTNLGNSFARRFEHSGDLADSDRAISSFRNAGNCLTGAASTRLEASLSWARLASRVDPSSALQGYIKALDLVPQAAWLGRSLTTRYRELSSIGAIASEAAAAASTAGQYETALEWLEQGRSIVWNQLLSLRTPVDLLRQVDRTLADDFERVSVALEHASTGNSSIQGLPNLFDHQLSMEESAQHHRRLAEEWERLVGRVRGIPGFDSFLRPKRFTQLRIAAKAGPVAVVNVHESRCDTFVLVDGLDEVVHIPLPDFSYTKAQKLHLHLNQLLSTAGVRVRDTDIRAMKIATTSKRGGFEFILSNLWSSVVKPVLDGLAFAVSHLLINCHHE